MKEIFGRIRILINWFFAGSRYTQMLILRELIFMKEQSWKSSPTKLDLQNQNDD